MSKKFLISLAPVLAVVAFVAMPVAAQAAPHWYSNGVKLVENGSKLRVQTFSKELKLVDKTVIAPATFEVKCEVHDLGKIWNPTGGGAGLDEVIQFVPVNPCSTNKAGCKVAVFPETAAGVVSLPWKTELEEPKAGEVIVKTKGVAVTVQVGSAAACETLANGEVEYKLEAPEELKPIFKNGTTGTKAGCEAAPPTTSLATFSATTGKLTSSLGTKGEITGTDCIWGATENQIITVKNP